ncbi:rod shape-determining protein MreC [Thioflavicoccus mobilis 8321]|uniref:Cell shape-determining protein MreC n=1 Tax=Thioflavicoccus mobilis 8321 TaxID=765912 RepID=L0GZW3_9GAMM|nr:rod shape-determining protein MreC [Thioflavicoccus mobilis]AGA91491.1 rod shape-determining protein MreC [Thioflavicoccus mobilis 8321]
MKPLFAQGPSLTARLVLAVVAALTLVFVDHRYQRLDSVRASLSVVVYPLYYIAGLPDTLMREVQGRLADEEVLRREKAELQQENLLLKVRLQRFAALEAENDRLRGLLGSSSKLGERVLVAELLAVDLDPYRHQVVVDKGSKAGVFVGQPVLDARAVMGQVVRVAPLSAAVLLITDSEHLLPVQVLRNGLRAVAQGTGLVNRLELLHLPKKSDVRVDDRLVTSGLGGRFPAGYPVARVVAVRDEPGRPFLTVLAKPLARLDRAREVLLVWSLSPEKDHAELEVVGGPDAASEP